MRTQKFNFLIAVLLLFPFALLQAQDDKSQAYWIHEDVVKPSMVEEYESICQELISNMKEHNIQEVNMIVANLIDNRYWYIGPIVNMAQLDNPVFATLSQKMGPEKMSDLFDRMNKCYDIEHDYVMNMDKDLSYMPGGITQIPEGLNYRKFHFYYYTPSNEDVVKERAAAIKKLYESKGSKVDYRVYKSGFGTRGAFYLVAIAAKDAADYANKIAENNELLGQDWLSTYNDFMSSLEKYEAAEGRMRPDMAYSPEN